MNKLIICMCLIFMLAGCVSNDLLPVAEPIGDAATLQTVLVATTRTKSDDPLELYGKGRSDKLNFADLTISIPKTREVGSLAYPTSAKPNLEKEFSAVKTNLNISQSAFLEKLNAELAERPAHEREVFLNIHGYNNSFSESVLRSAQLAHDYAITGVAVHFSWPSAGETPLYLYDRDSVQYSRKGLQDTIELLAQSNATSIVIFAHSMGTLLTMEAMRQISLENKTDTLSSISALALASPDIDADVFWTQLADIHPRPNPFVILVNKKDRALKVSDRVRGGFPRIGQGGSIKELQREGIAVIDLTNIDDSSDKSFHSVFTSSPKLIKSFRDGTIDQQVLTGADPNSISKLSSFAASILFLPN